MKKEQGYSTLYKNSFVKIIRKIQYL